MTGPPPLLQHKCLFSRNEARSAEYIGVAVAQSPLPADRCAVVPLAVAERGDRIVVPDTTVELDAGGELHVIHIDPDHALAGNATLAHASRQAVGALDTPQVLDLEHRVRSLRGVDQHCF